MYYTELNHYICLYIIKGIDDRVYARILPPPYPPKNPIPPNKCNSTPFAPPPPPPHTHTLKLSETYMVWGAAIAQWLKYRTRDWKITGSNPCWNGGKIFFSRVDFLCWLLFWYPFHPHVTTVAHKRSRSFCQKCRWQVTAKHAYTLRMWLCMKSHGAWLYGVHSTAVPRRLFS